jgi:hypothetical protein
MAADVTADAKALEDGRPLVARRIAEAIEHCPEDLGRRPDLPTLQQLLASGGISEIPFVKLRPAGQGGVRRRYP